MRLLTQKNFKKKLCLKKEIQFYHLLAKSLKTRYHIHKEENRFLLEDQVYIKFMRRLGKNYLRKNLLCQKEDPCLFFQVKTVFDKKYILFQITDILKISLFYLSSYLVLLLL